MVVVTEVSATWEEVVIRVNSSQLDYNDDLAKVEETAVTYTDNSLFTSFKLLSLLTVYDEIDSELAQPIRLQNSWKKPS